MFLIRQATIDDGPALLKLAKLVHFINLPADRDIINKRIVDSRRSFDDAVEYDHDRVFMFVLEDIATKNVIGTSSIVTHISWPGHPHVYLKVRRREHFSKDLQTGQVHLTLQLMADEDGPSEIGGLILAPSYRGHAERLGGQLSLMRFHFIGLHPDWFSDRILAEMMGALTPESRNLLWTYLGRRFINLDYAEADRFSQVSKEFMTSLFPPGEIYASLLPAVARRLIGTVGPETEPAKAMLERLGFKYVGNVDPFDGGPYLEAKKSDIPIVATTRRAQLKLLESEPETHAFVSFHGERFRAVRTGVVDSGDTVAIPREAMEAIGAEPGATVGVTPMMPPPSRDASAAAERAAT